MLSRNLGHKFDKKELNSFNNVPLVLNPCFHSDKLPTTIKDRILDAQTYNLFSHKKLLEIILATSSYKTGLSL